MPSTDQSIVINRPLPSVWDSIRDFHDLSWSQNVVASCEAVGDLPGTEAGAKRVLNGVFHETLIELNDTDQIIRYSIDDGPSPITPDEISNYVGVVSLTAQGDSTLVRWTSSWESNDDSAIDFCHGIYVALLDDMAASLNESNLDT